MWIARTAIRRNEGDCYNQSKPAASNQSTQLDKYACILFWHFYNKSPHWYNGEMCCTSLNPPVLETSPPACLPPAPQPLIAGAGTGAGTGTGTGTGSGTGAGVASLPCVTWDIRNMDMNSALLNIFTREVWDTFLPSFFLAKFSHKNS